MSIPRSPWVRELAPVGDLPVTPVCGTEAVAVAEAELGPGPVAWAVETCARLSDSAPAGGYSGTRGTSPQDDEAQRRALELGLLSMLCALQSGRLPTEADVAAESWNLNQRALRRGMPLAGMFRAMWQVQGRVQSALLEFLAAHGVARSPGEALALAGRLNEGMTAYLEVIQQLFKEAWERDLRQWQKNVVESKRKMARRLVEGSAKTDEAERVLGIRLKAHHVAVLAEETPGFRDLAGAALGGRGAPFAEYVHRSLAEPAARAGAQIVCVDHDDDTAAAWLTFLVPPAPDTLAALRSALATSATAWAAIGPPLFGPAGFRRSHLVALRLGRYARFHAQGQDTVFDLDSVNPAALLVDDHDFAQWFVEATLGELADTRAKIRDLRTTLLHYLASGRSLRGAAEALHIAPNTVAYRVRHAECVLPHGVERDPFAVMLALSLAEDLPELLEPDA
ncbi:helix-turn-helix domain-containing protein [Streptomyces sp. NPDC058464]|uniref:helix-turn-helix domain-containing protein n=1 Tax=Streptomyces sp. NPDC058464 TaxID=3346511 RepID=UPI00366279F7